MPLFTPPHQLRLFNHSTAVTFAFPPGGIHCPLSATFSFLVDHHSFRSLETFTLPLTFFTSCLDIYIVCRLHDYVLLLLFSILHFTMKATYALLVTGLASQQVAATWNFFDNYGTPNYSNNKCSEKQEGGFDWSDLNDGDSVGNYGDFDFSGGWKCANSFGKLDLLTKRTFGNKCIKNKVGKKQPASFGCNKRGFSISHMDISSEFDAELELHYTMQDGSICKQRGSCSAGGSTLKNTQCGGAKSVDIYLGSHHKGDQDSCEIGFHNIGFDCSPETPYTTPTPPEVPSTTSPAEYPTSTAESTPTPVPSTTPAEECGQYGGEGCGTTSVQRPTGGVCEGDNCYPASTPEASTSPSETPTPSADCGQYGGEGCNTPTETPTPEVPTSETLVETPTETPTETPVETPVETPSETPSETPVETPSETPIETPSETPVETPVETPTPDVPTSQVPASSPAPYTNTSAPAYTPPTEVPSSVVESTTATPPVESSATPECGYGQSCEESSAIVTSAVPSSTATPLPATSSEAPKPSSPSYPPVDITDSVPKCMNSWLQISAPGCKDNTDAKCYCVKPEFTKNVIDCLTARCGNDDDTRKALQYFIGICAEHIPENPKIVGDCPSYIPLNPTPSPPAVPTGGASAPVPGSSVPAAAESSSVAVPPTGGEGTPAPSVPAETPAPSAPAQYPAPSAPAEVPAPSAPAEYPAPSVPAGTPALTPIASTAPPAEQTPCTTITYGTTTLTVPQVHFTTEPSTPGSTPKQPVALVPGTAPPQTPATTTPAGGAVPPPYPTATTLGTATVPIASGTGGVRPSSPAEFTGAASPFSVVPHSALLGALLAFFAL